MMFAVSYGTSCSRWTSSLSRSDCSSRVRVRSRVAARRTSAVVSIRAKAYAGWQLASIPGRSRGCVTPDISISRPCAYQRAGKRGPDEEVRACPGADRRDGRIGNRADQLAGRGTGQGEGTPDRGGGAEEVVRQG